MSGVRMLHFLKDWWKFIQIHQNYTMALISWFLWYFHNFITKIGINWSGNFRENNSTTKITTYTLYKHKHVGPKFFKENPKTQIILINFRIPQMYLSTLMYDPKVYKDLTVKLAETALYQQNFTKICVQVLCFITLVDAKHMDVLVLVL